ncbi:integrase [Thermocatellispora tengchongensis]|uniref:Integrase n=1 Tax=Thermocatellispora tengchongensis TaxID=1073253 RepID=A0A840PJH5_9ACTN|nr:tyrosine-type recombinase/integrase [Thermocatellispora tengchongensis]MBB5136215.1 integrase [Thermocatellispora tengchongensis]
MIEATTREGYTYQIGKHLMPWFGPLRMAEILPSHVREWVTMMVNNGVTPATIQHVRNILSAIFTTALNDQITFLHPCKGVKTPTVPKPELKIITPEQFDTIYQALPNADMQLLIETAIETGLRWGELTELRVKDLNRTTRILSVRRAVVQVDPKFHPEGKRFHVKDYPKDKESRRLKLSRQIATKLSVHIDAESLGEDDLLFRLRDQEDTTPPLYVVPDPDDLGLTAPNAAGRRYRHGSLSGYNAGKCRCDHCKKAFATYRAERRAKGKDAPRKKRVVDTDGHIPRDWFRTNIWKPSLNKAGLDFHVRAHDLRHAHASWLLAGGADLQVVKERLGHGSITTTEKYLHTLPDADESAIDAFESIRYRKGTG